MIPETIESHLGPACGPGVLESSDRNTNLYSLAVPCLAQSVTGLVTAVPQLPGQDSPPWVPGGEASLEIQLQTEV